MTPHDNLNGEALNEVKCTPLSHCPVWLLQLGNEVFVEVSFLATELVLLFELGRNEVFSPQAIQSHCVCRGVARNAPTSSNHMFIMRRCTQRLYIIACVAS